MKEGRRVDFDQAYSDMIDHKYAFWLIQHLLSSNQTGSNFTEMLESMRMHLNNLYFPGHNSCYRVQPEADERLLTDLPRLIRY